MPSSTIADSVIESQSFMLSFHHFLENSEFNVMYDNTGLESICQKFLNISDPSFQDMNRVMAMSASSVLSGTRFPGSSDFNIQKIITSMVPYPRVHNVFPSYAPFLSKIDQKDDDLSLQKLIESVTDETNSLYYCDLSQKHSPDKRNVSITTCFQFRGDVQHSEIV